MQWRDDTTLPAPQSVWTLAYGDHDDRTRTHGYEAKRHAAMQAFARSWYKETWSHSRGG